MTSVESKQDERPLEYIARYGDWKFGYHLCYLPGHKRATIQVHVHPNGIVQVDAPESTGCQRSSLPSTAGPGGF